MHDGKVVSWQELIHQQLRVTCLAGCTGRTLFRRLCPWRTHQGTSSTCPASICVNSSAMLRAQTSIASFRSVAPLDRGITGSKVPLSLPPEY
jgi:hypothetical protein